MKRWMQEVVRGEQNGEGEEEREEYLEEGGGQYLDESLPGSEGCDLILCIAI